MGLAWDGMLFAVSRRLRTVSCERSEHTRTSKGFVAGNAGNMTTPSVSLLAQQTEPAHAVRRAPPLKSVASRLAFVPLERKFVQEKISCISRQALHMKLGIPNAEVA